MYIDKHGFKPEEFISTNVHVEINLTDIVQKVIKELAIELDENEHSFVSVPELIFSKD